MSFREAGSQRRGAEQAAPQYGDETLGQSLAWCTQVRCGGCVVSSRMRNAKGETHDECLVTRFLRERRRRGQPCRRGGMRDRFLLWRGTAAVARPGGGAGLVRQQPVSRIRRVVVGRAVGRVLWILQRERERKRRTVVWRGFKVAVVFPEWKAPNGGSDRVINQSIHRIGQYGQLDELASDPHFVFMWVWNHSYLLDWQMGAHGGGDYWSCAEDSIRRRQMGEMDGISRFAKLQTLLPSYFAKCIRNYGDPFALRWWEHQVQELCQFLLKSRGASNGIIRDR
ncbi:hypothetical protein DFH08DRAFT_821104 [Mycena albidolilacea]|uniref:Uncharacterized protein n=1 Tax=Mycena albidolilacea TaxID=1033008 RepID=A0AAD7EEN0_9AGAR|nr:hypothetical protein DFH08DRAFT_821104 [Mycena albidolilacea]